MVTRKARMMYVFTLIVCLDNIYKSMTNVSGCIGERLSLVCIRLKIKVIIVSINLVYVYRKNLFARDQSTPYFNYVCVTYLSKRV